VVLRADVADTTYDKVAVICGNLMLALEFVSY
jgi:hypothetical protein